MIIKKISLIDKRIVWISRIFSIVIFAFVIAITIISVKNSESTDTILLIIEAFLIIVSLGDLITSIFMSKSISISIMKKLIKHKYKNSYKSLEEHQIKFINKHNGKLSFNKHIFLEGEKSTGKTKAVIEFIEHLWENIQIEEDIKKITNTIFIDCSTEKDDIILLFQNNNQISYFADKLIVIDNVEKLPQAFIDEYSDLFKSEKSLFIIIKDIEQKPNEYKNIQVTDIFDNGILYLALDDIQELDIIQKQIVVLICILSEITSLVNKHEIYTLLNSAGFSNNKKQLHTLKKKGIINFFHFHDNYIYLNKNITIETHLNSNSKDDLFLLLIDNENTEALYKWLFLLRCSEITIRSINLEKKLKIFDEATASSEYSVMYNYLIKYEKNESFSSAFLYEKAVLAFYMGKHKESEYFLDILLSQSTLKRIDDIKLAIIQATHGSNAKGCIARITKYLDELSSSEGIYKIAADYWACHINTEKGIFQCEIFLDLIMQLGKYEPTKLVNSLTQRCYTDYIRGRHIMGEKSKINDAVFSDFLSFIGGNQKRQLYYKNLYTKANEIHYIVISNLFIDNKGYTTIHPIIKTAENYYKYAISLEYGDKKSVMAAELKLIDLLFCFSDFDFNLAKQKICDFKKIAEYNAVDIFVAYGCTMLVKLHILDPKNMTNDRGLYFDNEVLDIISKNYREGIEIYEKYENSYGVFRLHFLNCLFMLYRGLNVASTLIQMKKLLETKQDFRRENAIYQKLIDKYETMYLLSLIKSYPIILQ